MLERARSYRGAVTLGFRGKDVEVCYRAFEGEVEEWWFSDNKLNQVELTADECETIADAVWEDARW